MAEKSYSEIERAEHESRRANAAKTLRLAKIIRPLRTAKYECDYDWSRMQRALDAMAIDYGGLDLNPDFQRGHVWTPDQQRHYIENVLRGVVSSSGFLIQMNCPNWEDEYFIGDVPKGFQCIDGLQRLTAVSEFLAGRIRPFGLAVDDLAGSSFSIRLNYRFRFAIHNFTNRADLLQHYLDLNTGGTPHSASEIERVRQLHSDAAVV